MTHRHLRSLFFTAFVAGFSIIPAHAEILVFAGPLTASQVVAGGGSVSKAAGYGHVIVDTQNQTVTTDLTWSNLTGPADRAHLHDAPPGQPTDQVFEHDVFGNDENPARTVVCPFDDDLNFLKCAPATGSVQHDQIGPDWYGGDGSNDNATFQQVLSEFVAGDVYIDIHTEAYPDGEIRGQMLAVPEPATCVLLVAGLLALRVWRFSASPDRALG